jgi:hypothetical protein
MTLDEVQTRALEAKREKAGRTGTKEQEEQEQKRRL